MVWKNVWLRKENMRDFGGRNWGENGGGGGASMGSYLSTPLLPPINFGFFFLEQ